MSSELVQFHIHYDVNKHFIPMSDFLVAATSAQKIIDDLNKQFFNGQLRYQLMTLPPEDGTFLKTIGIWAVKVAVAGIVLPIAGGVSMGAFKALSGKSPEQYGEETMVALRDVTIGFFSKEIDELERVIPKDLNLDRAFKAKTDFYKSCQRMESLRAIGFDNTKNFPIKKADFSKHITLDKTRPLESDYCLYEAIIVSPVGIDKDSKWEFMDKKYKRKITAYMRDEEFKKSFLSGNHPYKTQGDDDEVKILVEYKKELVNGEEKITEISVKDVFVLNNKILKNIPENFDHPVNTTFISPKKLPMDEMWGAA